MLLVDAGHIDTAMEAVAKRAKPSFNARRGTLLADIDRCAPRSFR